ncbi:winged helix-turn-helix domain-containing protein [Paraburkholderia saeva]|uniref:winged helix-turn-helix domain-containing protein n=1 Tax=Paraburkholderia saeva TaxID=2777537 RepID=UPI001D30F0E7|nr:winged helix-turn-helix domain-containing protein [Paraburkholderia saeva]CAG4911655.1 hypothetical protein R52603_03948 [Paraburkholderia saeva]
MTTSKKQLQSKRAQMHALIQANPGITSGEIAERVGLDSASKVTTALWKAVRSGRILTERVEQNGRFMNAHYLPDQVPPDAVERINQKLVDAKDVIPAAKSPTARNSVFDVPRAEKAKKPSGRRAALEIASPSTPSDAPVRLRGFACAVTNDGCLVLMRQGQIEFSLSDVEAATLQSYLLRRAAANVFANMV